MTEPTAPFLQPCTTTPNFCESSRDNTTKKNMPLDEITEQSMGGLTAPFLPPCTSTPNLYKNSMENPTKKIMLLDEITEQSMGGFGLWKILQCILISFACFFDAQQSFISIFTDAPNTWHCLEKNSITSDCAVDHCHQLDGEGFSWQWDRPTETSIVSEWGLDCLGPAVACRPASAFFTGCAIGGFLLSTLADSYLGRRRMLFLTCLTMSLAGALTPISPNVWVYSAFRFISGFFRATMATSCLVLSMEIVGQRQRDQVTILAYFFFTLGFLSLPVIAYTLRESSWRYQYILMSVPGLAYSVFAYFFMVESPRWLVLHGRREEAIQELKRMAISIDKAEAIISSFSCVPVSEEIRGVGILEAFSSLKALTKRQWSLKRLACMMTIGFGLGLLYYGMPLAVGDLGTNLYWSVAINGLAEFPSSVATSLMVHLINRKTTVVATMWGSCVLCLACVVVKGKAVRMASEVGAFFFTCTAFNVAMIYVMELFPTCVRNSALSMLRLAVVMGGVIAPLLVALGRGGQGKLTFVVFGVVVGICGPFAFYLPETRGKEISDTMEEEEGRIVSKRLPVIC